MCLCPQFNFQTPLFLAAGGSGSGFEEGVKTSGQCVLSDSVFMQLPQGAGTFSV